MFGSTKRRRERLREQPFPEAWLRVLRRNVPVYERLPADDQRALRGHVQVFISEKNWEGLGGLEMTDEVRVTVAAQACLLLLQLDADYFPRLRSILVYPSTYVPRRAELVPAHGMLVGEPGPHLGESWGDGVIVLSWDSVRAAAADPDDGRNVVLHEFAHQLDQEEGTADGTPLLERASAYRVWTRVVREHFRELREEVERGEQDVLDAYGATNPAEFFAVTTEAFFETPHELRRERPELYEQLREFYRQDPAAWPAGDRHP